MRPGAPLSVPRRFLPSERPSTGMTPPRTPLLRPDRYFSEWTATLGRGIVVALVLFFGSIAVVYGLGGVLTANIDGTVETSNPEYPGDTFCDGDSPGSTPRGCTEPATIEQDIDRVLWDAVGSVAGEFIVGLIVLWLLVSGLLHGGSALADGDGAAERSLTVAAWGLLPTLFAAVVSILALALTFDPITVSPGMSQDAVRRQAVAQFDTLRTVGRVSGLVATVWGAVIWGYGLRYQRAIPGWAAAMVAGTVALVLFVLGAL